MNLWLGKLKFLDVKGDACVSGHRKDGTDAHHMCWKGGVEAKEVVHDANTNILKLASMSKVHTAKFGKCLIDVA